MNRNRCPNWPGVRSTTTNGYDNADRVTSVSTPAPASGQASQVTGTIYNNMGQVATNTLPDGGATISSYHLTGELATNSGTRTYPVAYTYDHAGRLKTMTTWTNYASAAGSAVTTWHYDTQRGWLTNKGYADGLGPKYTYTGAGRLATRAWARGVTTTYAYNPAGELATIDYSDSTPDATYTYDRRGRAIQVTGAATVASLYNDAGQVVSETQSGLTLTNVYDSRLRRTSLAVLNGSTVLASFTNAYDNASRLASVTFGTNSATYSYLTNSPLVETVEFKNGGTTRMTTSNRFDALNRLMTKENLAGSSVAASVGYAYNTANQRTAMTNTDGSLWSFGYDSLGQVTSGKRYWSDGNIVAGQQFEYSFDDIGNRKTVASGGDQWGVNLPYQNYSANNLNQYTQRTVPGYAEVQGSATNTATVTVNDQATYRKGDYYRAELNVNNSAAPVWQGVTNIAVLAQGTNVDIVTNITGSILIPKLAETFFHDSDGNQLSDSLWTNVWNGENRLVATESATGVPSGGKAKQTWSHVADGRWFERVVSTWNGSSYVAQSTNRFVWDGQVLLAIVDHTNGLIMSFARGLDLDGSIQGAGGIGGLLAVNVASNGVHFATFDGNGNLSGLVSATNGAATAQYEYSPFGESLRASGPLAEVNPIRFSTQLADDLTGTSKYLFRDYAATTGRWANRDTLGEQGGQNLYQMLQNNAVDSVDFLGLCAKECKATLKFEPRDWKFDEAAGSARRRFDIVIKFVKNDTYDPAACRYVQFAKSDYYLRWQGREHKPSKNKESGAPMNDGKFHLDSNPWTDEVTTRGNMYVNHAPKHKQPEEYYSWDEPQVVGMRKNVYYYFKAEIRGEVRDKWNGDKVVATDRIEMSLEGVFPNLKFTPELAKKQSP